MSLFVLAETKIGAELHIIDSDLVRVAVQRLHYDAGHRIRWT